MRVFWERNREVSRERSKKNDFRIAQRPYIEQPVNLDRCKYGAVSRDLSRRCREGIEEQHIRIKNRSSIDPPSVEKLSRIQTQSRSIHQVSRCRRDCDKKILRSSTDSQLSSRFQGGVEPAFKSSFLRCEKHRHECNPTCNSTNDPINILSFQNRLSNKI